MASSATKLQNYNKSGAPRAPLELIIPPDYAGLRLDQALAHLLPEYSRSRLTQWIRARKIELNGAGAAAKLKVYGGEKVKVCVDAEPAADAAHPESIPLEVVHEDAHIIVIAKPAGLVVHPGSGNWSGTLLNALLHHAPALSCLPRAGIVHRLDKDTSGLLVVAKTLEAQTQLVRQLQARTVKREYLALVHGEMAGGGKVDRPIGRHPTQRTRMAIVARGRAAATHYEVLERFSRATLLRCRLETGRTHQIRVHLQALGHPLVGDPVYGRKYSGIALLDNFVRQALHAHRLGLLHPATGRAVSWEAAPPADMQELLDGLVANSREPRDSRR